MVVKYGVTYGIFFLIKLLSRMEDAATNEVIFLISKYVIRRAFKVFAPEARLAELKRIVASLYLTSKHLKNSICDELWLEVMHRWMKGSWYVYLELFN